MQVWLFENPWPLAGLLLVLAGLAGVVFWLTRRNGPFIAMVLLALLALVPFLLDAWVVTPAEQVDLTLDRLVAAALQSNPELIVQTISPNYNDDAQSYQSLVSTIRQEFGHSQFNSISLNGRQFETNGDAVTARFVAVVSGSSRGMAGTHYPIRLALTFRKEPEGWRIVRVQRFELASNTDREIPLTTR